MALNGRVLLLNQTCEPLGTVSVARAIIMTFKNSVFVEEWDGDRVLRSAHDEFPAVGNSPAHLHQRSSTPRAVGHEALANLHARQVSLPILR